MAGPVTPTVILVDEAWHWLRHPHAALDLEAIARRFRKRQGSLQLATQHFLDLEGTGSARVIRDTAGIRIFFRQQLAAARAVTGLFGLNEAETSGLQVLAPGEALLAVGDKHVPIYVAIPPDLLRLFSTRPQEAGGG
jgi:type IV secretory pathway VirB4 component